MGFPGIDSDWLKTRSASPFFDSNQLMNSEKTFDSELIWLWVIPRSGLVDLKLVYGLIKQRFNESRKMTKQLTPREKLHHSLLKLVGRVSAVFIAVSKCCLEDLVFKGFEAQCLLCSHPEPEHDDMVSFCLESVYLWENKRKISSPYSIQLKKSYSIRHHLAISGPENLTEDVKDTRAKLLKILWLDA